MHLCAGDGRGLLTLAYGHRREFVIGPTLSLTRELIARRSLTPDDAGCQALLEARLAPLGFRCETLVSNGVTNLWARRGTQAAAGLLRRAHRRRAHRPARRVAFGSVRARRARRLPLRARRRRHEKLARGVRHGDRGVSRGHADAPGSIALLITSDEEGPSIDGTVKVVERLAARGERIDYCVVGEPSSVDALGDMIKNGRRGTLSGTLVVKGVQGHIAYPHLARNPIHLVAPVLAELAQATWDNGNEYFPPTTWQCSNIHAGTGATNVIPGTLEVMFNFRHSPDEHARIAHAALRGDRAQARPRATSSRGPDRASRSSRRAAGWSRRRRRRSATRRAACRSFRAPAALRMAASSPTSAPRSSSSVRSTRRSTSSTSACGVADLEPLAAHLSRHPRRLLG